MRSLKVLVADDSVVYRSQIKEALDGIPGVEVVATASNGRRAIERLEQMPIDIVILDVEMPEMNGLQTLAEISKRKMACKVLMFSSGSKRSAEITLEALGLGAWDFIAKPGGQGDSDLGHHNIDVTASQKIRALFEPKLQNMIPISAGKPPTPAARPAKSSGKYPKILWDLFNPQAVVIASSTGGPTALENIFSQLAPPVSCPILIAQHMPPVFTATLAERIARASGIPAREARHGELLQKNQIYIAPGDYHMRIDGPVGEARILLDQGPLLHSVRPAADHLFESAAAVYKNRLLGIVLTGMGYDGKSGAEAIKRAGGAVLIQSEDSCVVFGMPGAVKEVEAFDHELDPDQIAATLHEKIGLFKKPQIKPASGGH